MNKPDISEQFWTYQRKLDKELIATIRCVSGQCDEQWHSETYPVNPGDTETILAMLLTFAEQGVSRALVISGDGGQLGEIMSDGSIWVINPN